MQVLLVGGGGREAALAWRLAQSPLLHTLWVTDDNPGFPAGARRLPDHPEGVAAAAAAAGVGLVVVGPEAPLADGLVDRCRALGVPAFGPTAAAARLEASKAFAKAFMQRHGVPAAASGAFDDAASARAAVDGPCVVKADGLAGGKGVFVCDDAAAARAAVDALFAERPAGRVLVEERLEGPELSVLALCDGQRFVLLPPARDHKRRYDGDRGPNTGGMGAFAPVAVPGGLLEEVARRVIAPTLEGMAAEGAPFTGCLYAGLMLTADGPKVLEFNCRFGDPECQPLMALLDEDLLPRLLGAARGELDTAPLALIDGAACCVVMVNQSYPDGGPRGAPISGLDDLPPSAIAFHAGTVARGGELLATGGRVLGVTATGATLEEARRRSYAACERIRWNGADYRRDIATTGS
jgi:phosphoribosylamine--glycine ligase